MARRSRHEPYGIPLGKRRLKRALDAARSSKWGLRWIAPQDPEYPAAIAKAFTDTNRILADLSWTETP